MSNEANQMYIDKKFLILLYYISLIKLKIDMKFCKIYVFKSFILKIYFT